MQNYHLLDENGFADGYNLGLQYYYNGYYPLGGGAFEYSGGSVTCVLGGDGSRSRYVVLNNSVDLTGYSTVHAIINYVGQTYDISVDVSTLSGNYYIAFGWKVGSAASGAAMQYGLYVKSNPSTYAEGDAVAHREVDSGYYGGQSVVIPEIWLE